MENANNHLIGKAITFFDVHTKYKKTMHNQWRDGFEEFGQEILSLVKLIHAMSSTENEQKGLIHLLQNSKVAPMDVPFFVHHYLGESY